MRFFTQLCLILAVVFAATFAVAQAAPSAEQELAPGSAHVIAPEDLLKLLQASGEKPVVLNVGPALLFMQARIPGAEFIGAASTPQGLEKLRARAKTLPHDKLIVLYCGCCPWSHCPNVRPAYSALQKLGFSDVKVLYIADNFGADWVDKGYPTVRGQ